MGLSWELTGELGFSFNPPVNKNSPRNLWGIRALLGTSWELGLS